MIASQHKLLTLSMLYLLVMLVIGLVTPVASAQGSGVAIRFMTFNLEDVRLDQASTPDDPRLKQLAEVIQRIRPNVLLLNEIESVMDPEQHTTADLFIRNYLMYPQAEGLEGIVFDSYTPDTNTGIPSGHDLDRSGEIFSSPPERSERQTPQQRAYGGDCYGFGTFPGQYGMALLVDPKLTIQESDIHTFQRFLWKDLPDVQPPRLPDGTPYYSENAWNAFRLSSKTHAVVPIKLPNRTVVHAIISHPTPPAFDGPEQRNKLRNRDEIRLIAAIIDDQDFLYDDRGISGGIPSGAAFVVMGDLNADPIDGSSIGNPINTFLLSSNQFADAPAPASWIDIDGLDSTDTSGFRLRVDYVLPSADLKVLESGLWRHGADLESGFGSDHFPVWVDLLVPSN